MSNSKISHMPVQQSEERVIAIAQHLRADVSQLWILIQHHQKLLAELQNDLRQTLRVGHGIDIAEPGWHLDVPSGTLVHIAPPATDEDPEPDQAS